MTLEEFVKRSGKKESTVKKWIRKGWVNGASYTGNTYVISDLVFPPYTRAKHNTANAVRKGIVIGCKRRLSVNAALFQMSEYEFNLYVDQLVESNLIEKHIVDGNTYYYSTPKADELSDSQIYKTVKGLTQTVVQTAVGAMTERFFAHA